MLICQAIVQADADHQTLLKMTVCVHFFTWEMYCKTTRHVDSVLSDSAYTNYSVTDVEVYVIYSLSTIYMHFSQHIVYHYRSFTTIIIINVPGQVLL